MRVQRHGNAFTGTSGVPGVLLEARVGVALFFLTSDVGTIRIPDSCLEFFAAQANGLRRQGPQTSGAGTGRALGARPVHWGQGNSRTPVPLMALT